ncbi:hypothetical protein LXL04_005628 [Taraxacum kok-saghyz]
MDLQDICTHLGNVNMQPVANGFRFNWNTDGNYTVCTLRKMIDSKISTHQTNLQMHWSKTIPLKIKCCIWRVMQDRIPMAVNLEKRGVSLQSALCPLCNNITESVDHIMIRCPIATEARTWIFNWCNIPITNFSDVNEFVNYAADWGRNTKEKERIIAIMYALLWTIWVERNNAVFKGINAKSANIVDEVINKCLQARWIE